MRANPLLAALALVALLVGLAGGIISPVIVAFMTRTLGFKPGVLGNIWAVGGLTSMAGALFAGPLALRSDVGLLTSQNRSLVRLTL